MIYKLFEEIEGFDLKEDDRYHCQECGYNTQLINKARSHREKRHETSVEVLHVRNSPLVTEQDIREWEEQNPDGEPMGEPEE